MLVFRKRQRNLKRIKVIKRDFKKWLRKKGNFSKMLRISRKARINLKKKFTAVDSKVNIQRTMFIMDLTETLLGRKSNKK